MIVQASQQISCNVTWFWSFRENATTLLGKGACVNGALKYGVIDFHVPLFCEGGTSVLHHFAQDAPWRKKSLTFFLSPTIRYPVTGVSLEIHQCGLN